MNRKVKTKSLIIMASCQSNLSFFLVCLSCVSSTCFLVRPLGLSLVLARRVCLSQMSVESIFPAYLWCLSSPSVCCVCLFLLPFFLFPLVTSLCACACLQELAIRGWTNMVAVGRICEAIYVKYCCYSWVVMVHYFPWAAALQINDLLIDIWTILGPFIQKYIINVGSARFRGGKRKGVCNHAAAFV